jgi:lysophospholipase L1-like esterase
VVNAARGGASIGKELAILEQVALPLEPRIVILTFVTNDPAEIIGKEPHQLLNQRVEVHRKNVPLHERAALWLITRTAVGEGAFRLFLHIAARGGAEADTEDASTEQGVDARYVVAGATDYERNATIFLQRNRRGDGLVLTDPLSPRVLQLMQLYFVVLEEFVATCRSHDIEPVLVYFPAYPQIYLPGPPRAIQDLLAGNCERLGIPFLDLTPAFRRAGRDQVLHLAPLDYHLNPRGNQVMAEAIHEFLEDRGLVGRPAPGNE